MNDPFEIPESDAPRRDRLEEHLDLEHRLSQASEAKPEAMQDAGSKMQEAGGKMRDIQASPDNLDLPSAARPATASTERGTAARTETGPEKPEVENLDSETRSPRPPEGWRPGGPEGRG